MSKIENRIKISQAKVPSFLKASPELYKEARALLLCVLGTEIEDARMMMKNLADNVPGTRPHLGGAADHLRSAAGALTTLSTALDPKRSG